MKHQKLTWFLASEKKRSGKSGEQHLFVTGGPAVIVGRVAPQGAVMAHLKRRPPGTWVVRYKFDDQYSASITSLLGALQTLDEGFEPHDSHVFDGRPGFLAVIDWLVMAASKSS